MESLSTFGDLFKETFATLPAQLWAKGTVIFSVMNGRDPARPLIAERKYQVWAEIIGTEWMRDSVVCQEHHGGLDGAIYGKRRVTFH